ncbi:uncharacterized protein LOC143527350 [Brachyhypopomus gauderio]|uniref:uncharacterized protein LOC143527350 n=1 Tax=Brachyhypopomus gauderio TaxID=698409 RepID=UPI004042A8F8
METSRVALLTLMCLVFSSQKISGREEQMRVRQGDDITLFSDCVWKTGRRIFWLRNSSHGHQPPLNISAQGFTSTDFPRYSIEFNPSYSTYDLRVKNITEADLGLYYCAVRETAITSDKNGAKQYRYVYHYGKKTIRLSLLDSSLPAVKIPHPTYTSTPPVPECGVCWTLLITVCPVCVLLSSLLSSTCVYCLCHKRHPDAETAQRGICKTQSQKHRNTDEAGDEVSYSSIHFSKDGQKHPKKKRVQNSDFSTYAEVRTGE